MRFVLAVLMAAATAAAEPLDLALPTGNTALLEGRGSEFYMFTDRDFEGVKSTPWQAGQYGYVRDPRRLAGSVVFTRFHEGLDIRPLMRDPAGRPLDEVRAIGPGTVVYTSNTPSRSNYGRYIVLEHRWGGSPCYSLYAHLHEIAVRPGQAIERGARLGVLGFTGTGIDQRRAHLHLELNLLLSPRFDPWHTSTFPGDKNWHGLYNGLNLAGLDLAALYLALAREPALTIPEFIARQRVEFKAHVPPSPQFALPEIYPWMVSGKKDAPPGWEISFDSTGLPLRIEPTAALVEKPSLSWLRESPIPAQYRTKNLIRGRALTSTGQSYLRLLLGE